MMGNGITAKGSTTIARGIKAVDLGLYISKYRALVVGDFHLGYEDALHRQGVLVPRFQLKDIAARIEDIIKKCPDPLDSIIINGDIKHDFARITSQEWRGVLYVIDMLLSHCKELVVVKGNHDVQLGPIAAKRGIKVVDQVQWGDLLILHGDEIPSLTDCKTIIIGHEHPAVGIKRGSRFERFKCFLKGSFRGRNLIVVPSFHLATEGTDVLREARISPFLQGSLDKFEVFVVADRVYPFGLLGDIDKIGVQDS